jgi:hypothetical protein
MFSSRSHFELSANELAAAVAARRRARLPLLDLTDANPTRAGLARPAGALRAALEDSFALDYAPEPFGEQGARGAVCDLYAGVVAPDALALAASTSEAYAWLLKLLCDPGDRVLVPRPSYPLLDYLAALECVALDRYPLHFAGEWFVDLDALAAAIGPRTRAVIAISPGNPTGHVLRRAEADALVALCRERGLALVCDEVFADWRHDASRADCVATLAGTRDALTFVLSGLSKLLLLPQAKLAWIAASGPADLLAAALARLELIADTYLSVATSVQRALPGLLALRAPLQAPLRARLLANRARLAELCAGTPVSPLPSEGGWCAVLRVPGTRDDADWARLLVESEGILVHPGHFYDFASHDHLVLSLLAPEASFADGVARLVRRVEKAYA